MTGRIRVSAERNTELSVECLIRPAEADPEPMPPLPEFILVQIARFGTAVAQRMAEQHTPLSRLLVQAVVSTASAPASPTARLASIDLYIHGDGAHLEPDELQGTAVEVAAERSRWRGPSDAVPVRVVSVGAASAHPRVDEPVATSDEPTPPVVAALPPDPPAPSSLDAAAPVAASPPASPSHAPATDVRVRRLVLVSGGMALLAAIVVLALLPALESPPPAPVSEPNIAARPLVQPTEASAPTSPPLPSPLATLAPATVAAAQPTQTSQASATIQATPTAEPRPTAPPTLVETVSPASKVTTIPSPSVAPGPRTILEAGFASGRQQGWPDNPASEAWFASGGYHLRARTPGQFVAVAAPQGQSLSDVVVSLRYRKVDGPPGGGVGVILRDQEPGRRDGLNQTGRFYVFEVSDRGEVGIWRREADAWVDLVPWTRSEAVQPAADGNVLEARAIGARLTLLVNGTVTAGATDAALGQGGVGVFLGGDDNEAILDNLVIQTPS
jgi:hypothetical protein